MRVLQIKSLKPKANGWIDRDYIILHACFQLLKECVEEEHVDTHCNYESNKEFVDEVRFLYNWWGDRSSKERSDKQDTEDDMMLIRLMKIRTSLWT